MREDQNDLPKELFMFKASTRKKCFLNRTIFFLTKRDDSKATDRFNMELKKARGRLEVFVQYMTSNLIGVSSSNYFWINNNVSICLLIYSEFQAFDYK